MVDLMRRRSLFRLIILLVPVLITLAYLAYSVGVVRAENAGLLGAVLDDTWIHIRFADHLAAGEGLTYNDGVLTSGATSPLWVLTLAAAFTLTRPPAPDQINTAIALSAAGYVLCVLTLTGLAWSLTRRAWVGLVAGCLLALSGRMIWHALSGMEVTTFAAFCLAALWSHVDDLRHGRTFGWRTGTLAALATMARPEGYLLALLIGAEAVLLPRLPRPAHHRGNLAGRVLASWRGSTAYLLLAGTYPLVCWLISGHPLPNTFRVKSQLGREWPNLPFSFFWQMRQDYGWLVIVVIGIGLGWLLWQGWQAARPPRDSHESGDRAHLNSRPHRPAHLTAHLTHAGFVLPLWPAVFVLAVLFMGADRYVVNHSRYVAPAVPFHMLLAAVGVYALGLWLAAARLALPDSLRRGAPALVSAVLLVFVFVSGANAPNRVANDVRQLRTMHIAAAEWVTQTTQPDDLIALNDVGAIVHLSDRRVLDLEGLVSAEVIDAAAGTARGSCERDLALMRLMLVQRPALVGVFPWWYPCMTGWPGALQPFTVFTITGPTVIGGGELVIYWPQWDQWPVQAQIAPEALPLAVDFEQGIQLAGVQMTEEDSAYVVTLWWRATAVPQADYTVFVHLNDGSGTLLTQHDSPPQDDRFRTSWWRAGDLIRDVHRVPRPAQPTTPEGLFVRVGLYPTGGGANLPRVAAPADQPDFLRLPLRFTAPRPNS